MKGYRYQDMQSQCDDLRRRLSLATQMPKQFDALGEYRQMWDSKGIKSEGKDGWPLPFCFNNRNINLFHQYWRGDGSKYICQDIVESIKKKKEELNELQAKYRYLTGCNHKG